jgi:poly-gamma-glutamate synthesis protein (capsule biosynthesis protein)
MTEQILGLRSQVDILVVAFHWVAEYAALPMQAALAADDPVELGHRAVDAGADLIIGNHPHWVQGLELYAQKLITYAHGNFIFDQMWSYETRVSVIGRYTFYDNILVGVTFMPTLVVDYAQPVLLEGRSARRAGADEGGERTAGRERQPHPSRDGARCLRPSSRRSAVGQTAGKSATCAGQ